MYVLLLQTQIYIAGSIFLCAGQVLETPLGTVQFLGQLDDILCSKFPHGNVSECMDPAGILISIWIKFDLLK